MRDVKPLLKPIDYQGSPVFPDWMEKSMEVPSLPDLPQEGKGKTYRQKDNLNRLGRWVESLNTILGTNQVEMARSIGLAKQTLSDATRGKNSTGRETILALVQQYQRLAEEKHVTLPVAWEVFFSVSWFDVAEVIGPADQALGTMEQRADVVKECQQLTRELAKERLRKEELSRENQALRRENRAMKRELDQLRAQKRDS